MRTLHIAVSLALLAPVARAAETASFLEIGAGARALGMGGAYTALADDANAIYWNPAGLSRLEKREVAASHAEIGQGIRHDFVAAAYPTTQGTFAAAAAYLSQSALDGRDAAGRPTGGYSASDAAMNLGWGRKTETADLGASVKYIRSHIGSAEAQTFALDAGARKTLGAVILAAALRNAGPGLKYDAQRNDLPLRLALGAAYRLTAGHALTAEFIHSPRGAGNDAGFGGEFQAFKGVCLRGGYTTRTAVSGGSSFDAARGLTVGLGLRNERWGLDYAANPMGELGSTHRFTLSARW